MRETQQMYSELRKERMRYLKLSYMEQDPQDVEHMVLALRNHFM